MSEFLKIQSDSLKIEISPYGAALARVWLAGHDTSLVLGLDRPEDYRTAPDYSGVIVGPIAGRVSGASFNLQGATHEMEANAGKHCLHSGSDGIQNQLWDVVNCKGDTITLSLSVSDGSCGLPGARRILATYTVSGSNLILSIDSTSDRNTAFNATLHAYWALDSYADLDTHRLQVQSTHMCETGHDLIPTGQIIDMSDTDHDFSAEKSPMSGSALDGCFCFDGDTAVRPMMTLRSTRSGIGMQVHSNQPGLVLYTGEFLTPGPNQPSLPQSRPFSAIAIEAQGWPDAVNNENFPSILLKASARKQQITRFSFTQP
ncbi:MAG: aldose epimerase family protein [Paracoccaceae bacterium]